LNKIIQSSSNITKSLTAQFPEFSGKSVRLAALVLNNQHHSVTDLEGSTKLITVIIRDQNILGVNKICPSIFLLAQIITDLVDKFYDKNCLQ